MQDSHVITARALSRVTGPDRAWHAFAFDLTAIRHPIVSADFEFTPRGAAADTTLSFGYDGSEVLGSIAIAPADANRAPGVRVPFSETALRALNAAAGGALYLDAWASEPERRDAIEIGDVRLVLRAAAGLRRAA